MRQLSVELDHLFILCAEGGPEARALTDLGLVEGSGNHHPGQGTACRRFFFETLYLELMWVEDAAEAQSEPARRTGLWERWHRRQTGGCPFGVVLRPAATALDPAPPPFPAWSYQPAYFPPGGHIDVATGIGVDEPAFFWMPFQRGPARRGHEPRVHACGSRVSKVRIELPVRAGSAAARAAEEAGLLVFEPSHPHLLELTFDRARSGRRADLGSTLPLRLRW